VLRAADRPVGADRRIGVPRDRARGRALGVPDQIFAILVQYAFVAAAADVAVTATAGAAALQRHRRA
jgi:hypothetical protein